MGNGNATHKGKAYKIEAERTWSNVRTKYNLQQRWNFNSGNVIVKRSGWKTVRIFVSSTFKDFHHEREVLVKEIFPDLREWCEARRLHLIECDLRWGIPQDSQSEAVLRACLGEIDRCYEDNIFPFFINMTGDRVGWIPAESEVPECIVTQYHWIHGLSMTEMEIVHAAFRKDNPNALFMLREPHFLKSLPTQHKDVFVDGNPKAPVKLELLKKHIEQRFPILAFIREPTCDVPLLVLGDAGCGKTSILSKVTDTLVEEIDNSHMRSDMKKPFAIVYHFVGSTPKSTSACNLVHRIMNEINAEELKNTTAENVPALLCSYLGGTKVKPIIIIVDAVNQLEDCGDFTTFQWIPAKLSPNVRCVFSLITNSIPHKEFVKREPKPVEMTVNPLDFDTKKAIVDNVLEKYNKRLTEEQMTSLLAKRSSDNPLWLSIALEELRIFGFFKVLTQKIQSLPDGLLELEVNIISRFEKENGGELLIATLCLLECSSKGLLETELRDLLGDEGHLIPKPEDLLDKTTEKGVRIDERETLLPLSAFKFSAVYRALKPFLRPFGSSGEGRLDFYHRSLSKAVRKKYFCESEISAGPTPEGLKRYEWYHNKLANYFKHVRHDERKAEEYPYQLLKSGRNKELPQCLSEWSVIRPLYSEEMSRTLLYYWRESSGGLESMDDHYWIVINNWQNSPTLSKADLWERLRVMINLLIQGGRYKYASELVKDLLELEITVLGNRPEKLVEIYWLKAHISDKILCLIPYMYASQIPEVKSIIESYEQCVNLRKSMCDDKNDKRKLGKTLSRIGFWYAGWHLRGGSVDVVNNVNVKEKAISMADEAIKVFEEIGDPVGKADAITTRGVVVGRAEPEQLKYYKMAEEIILKNKGDKYYNLDRVYLNIGIYYEEVGELSKAYDYFRKWFRLCDEIYGSGHSVTQRCISTLHEAQYERIAKQRGDEIPEYPVCSLSDMHI